MRGLIPSHVVFNGKVGALTGKNAMKAKVGETVLIVHSQANRDTRPHLIGGHGDYVWESGKFSNPPETNLETWFVRGGSAAAALYTFRQPGIYAYLNHNLIEAVLLGATAHFKVEGEWNNDLMTQVKSPARSSGRGRAKRLTEARSAATYGARHAGRSNSRLPSSPRPSPPARWRSRFGRRCQRRQRHRAAGDGRDRAGHMHYWAPGEFDRGGKPANAPRATSV